ncbi:MAG: glutamine-hydrolyzing carbamoyl-phosphate synthase small subunit, partial [Simkaniaceae bacterium]|nr:glutamine-hydrolyzing carbamoyl-phosphate synthase small subunit [Simkaniaceae bacterium]
MKQAKLILKSGEVFNGTAPDWQKGAFCGEVVFTTGMTGYTESLTDPSFAGQILVFTYPLIGNYGVMDKKSWESKKIQVAGVVVSEAAPFFSHGKSKNSLLHWLQQEGVPLIADVDTRTLTRMLRSKGVALGAISDGASPKTFIDPNTRDLVAEVSTDKIEELGSGAKTVIAVDCGMKENIMRNLKKFPWKIKKVPYNYDFTKEHYDAVFLSNGPGDPAMCKETIANIQAAMKMGKPIFGICLGAQLMALAAGAKTYKLKFGHRGQNQPVLSLCDEKCFLT